MNFYAEVWAKLSSIDAKPLKQTNNKAEYITWSKVWRVIMETYPASVYSFDEREITVIGDNGPAVTVEVSCTLTIVENATRPRKAERTMHLPVMASFGQFLAIENPSARQISDARMRCLVKAAAMFGLGLTLWSGDEFQAVDNQERKILDFAKKKSDYRMSLWRTAIVIKEGFKDQSPESESTALEAWRECSEPEMHDLWLAETKGGFFTMAEKEWIRSLKIVLDD